jgi:hypothetical protein
LKLLEPQLAATVQNIGQLQKEVKVLKRSKESMRKKHEWIKLKHSRALEARDEELK